MIMCGVVGYIGAGLGPGPMDHLLSSMFRRGPDGEGRYSDGTLHMGMRRLAVIDVARGNQPLYSREGRVVAFQNGEIYNHLELRAELQTAGYVFLTHSDTEVLAHGFVQWGIEGLLSRLDGMYAIAIYDGDRKTLHLARDRYGEKPLYYSAAQGCFGYASSLLVVSALPWVRDEIDKLSLARYMALHFVPGDRTILSDVRQVLPGQFLTVDLATLRFSLSSYSDKQLPKPREVTDDELAHAIERAVSSRMISDVPVGIFLSGGLDSSLIAAIAARCSPRIATFSMGFNSDSLDESAHASAVARHIGSSHHTLRFDQDQFMTLVPKVAATLDTPLGDQAQLPLYRLAEEARKTVTVVLSGEGADEIFAGYGYYRQFVHQDAASKSRLDWTRWFPASTRRSAPTARLLQDGPPETASGFPLLSDCGLRQRLVGADAYSRDDWEVAVLAWLATAHDELQRATAADIATWLPDDLLVKFDRMAMAHSLEGRAPFLAPDVVRLGLELPATRRMDQRISKVSLRRLARRYLPDSIVDRSKQGFVLPMRQWLRQWFVAMGGTRSYLAARVVPALAMDELEQVIDADLIKGVERERLLFAIVMLCEWWHGFEISRRQLRSRIVLNRPGFAGSSNS